MIQKDLERSTDWGNWYEEIYAKKNTCSFYNIVTFQSCDNLI